MTRDDKLIKVEQSGANRVATMNGQFVVSNDIASLQWLLDVGVIDSIERGGKWAKYRGKL